MGATLQGASSQPGTAGSQNKKTYSIISQNIKNIQKYHLMLFLFIFYYFFLFVDILVGYPMVPLPVLTKDNPPRNSHDNKLWGGYQSPILSFEGFKVPIPPTDWAMPRIRGNLRGRFQERWEMICSERVVAATWESQRQKYVSTADMFINLNELYNRYEYIIYVYYLCISICRM